MAKSWEELGKRVQAARKDLGFTQVELAAKLRIDRTSVTKIEAGERRVDSLELAQLANALRRPIAWFVTEPLPSVVSRRASREVTRQEDIQLEILVQDVEQLISLEALRPVEPQGPANPIEDVADTEKLAVDARRRAGLSADAPVWEIIRVVERLGLYVFVLPLETQVGTQMDGSYVALARGGVALVGDGGDSGRRRFTIAHELGHHVLADEYAAEWVVGAAGATDREKIINAFAIHFLLPRAAVEPLWSRLDGTTDPRGAAIRIAVEFGMSWSATCAQLHRLGCLSEEQHASLCQVKPTSLEHAERELTIRDDVRGPLVPPGYAAAVVNVLRKGKIGPGRALELLHGTVLARDLPEERVIPIEAMTAELDLLPD